MGFMGFKRKNVPNCNKCTLGNCTSPKLAPQGQGARRILVVGEAPDYLDDMQGSHWASSYGDALRGHLSAFGVDLDVDCVSVCAVNCYPTDKKTGEHKNPAPKDYVHCRPIVEEAIKELNPNLIMAFGEGAFISLGLQEDFGEKSTTFWSGKVIPSFRHNAWISCHYDPEHIISNSRDNNLTSHFERTIQYALGYETEPLPTLRLKDYEKRVQVLTEYQDVIAVLQNIIDNPPEHFIFDYETTGLKPYKPGHKIASVSFATSIERAHSFPMQWPGHWTPKQFRNIRRLWNEILLHFDSKKVAHNIPHEDAWTYQILKCRIENWYWDTMVAQHQLDTTNGTKSLKAQVGIRYGIIGYEDEVGPFLKEDPSTPTFNRIFQAPLKKLLMYGGLDSLFEAMLFFDQLKDFRWGSKRNKLQQECVTMFNEGIVELARITQTGFRADSDYFAEQDRTSAAEIKKLTDWLMATEEAHRFREKVGRDIVLSSNPDLQILFFDIMHYKAKKKTKGGADSVDSELLVDVDTPFTKALKELRKQEKINGTFVAQFIENDCDGLIHTNFNLHVARSGRSSSNAPNFQNIPKRDPLAKKVVRSGIFPFRGEHLNETDFESLEVKIFTCHTKDPVMMAYLADPASDMHRDEGKALFMLPDDYNWKSKFGKALRFEAKNGWVFAQFYGSYFRNCARKIWEKVALGNMKIDEDTTFREHIASHGIRNLDDFTAHLKAHEEEFWNKFAVTREYQKGVYRDYLKKGYIQTMFGFRRGGYLHQNKLVNTPTQGTGFQCLLWSLIELSKMLRKERMRTRIVGQIHDSLMSSTPPDEKDHWLTMQEDVMTKKIRERFEWLIVPMGVEVEITEVDMPWSTQKPVVKTDGGIWVYKQ